MGDEVVVAEKTNCPVNQTEKNEEAWDNSFFCNELDGIYLQVKVIRF